MAITDNKITDQSVYWVKSAPDVLVGTPTENKNVFDKLSVHIIDKFNASLDEISSAVSEQSDYIGTVHDDILEELHGMTITQGAFVIHGRLESENDLPETGEDGDAWLVGYDPQEADDYPKYIYVWDINENAWVNGGTVVVDYENISSNIQMDGIANAGSGHKVARANHVHPTDTSRASQVEVDGIQTRLDNLVELVYPVGSVYINVNNIDPANLFGGEWEKLEDMFLVASGTQFQQGSTGGNTTVTFRPNGTVESHTLTINEMPSHLHRLHFYKSGGSDPASGYSYSSPSQVSADTELSSSMLKTGGSQGHDHPFTGNDTTINIVPPYLAVNVWKRIA